MRWKQVVLNMAALAAVLLVGVTVMPGVARTAAPETGTDYRSTVESWRRQREERLKAEGGWLSLAGLFWLRQGTNTFGVDSRNDIVLPPGSAPERAGVFVLRGDSAEVRLERGTTAALDGQAVSSGAMRSDATGKPSVLSLGRVTLHLIKRGGRLGIRVKDPQAAARTGFKGLDWYPVNETWRVKARFVPYDKPRTIRVPNVLGEVEPMSSPGYAVFQVGGRELRLEPVLEIESPKQLFFIFRDGTSGKETYGSGRFLYADLPSDGALVLDFNKAYSPPCAFTAYATCPLPPPQNRLPVKVEAGEKHAGHH